MRISDWSSDVCSSDLRRAVGDGGVRSPYRRRRARCADIGTRDGNSPNGRFRAVATAYPGFDIRTDHDRHADHAALFVTVTCRCTGAKRGYAYLSLDLAGRKGVVLGKECSVRVDFGGR